MYKMISHILQIPPIAARSLFSLQMAPVWMPMT